MGTARSETHSKLTVCRARTLPETAFGEITRRFPQGDFLGPLVVAGESAIGSE